MYSAKGAGKARCEVFDAAMRARAVARLQVEIDLRRAVERQEFCLHYQPILELDSKRVAGFEALRALAAPRTRPRSSRRSSSPSRKRPD